MPKKTTKSITVEDVRRWRKAAFEEVLKQSHAQRVADDEKLLRELGLKAYSKPKLTARRKAS